MFWRAFERRVTSDPKLLLTLVYLYKKKLISSRDKFEIVLHVSLRPFQSNLVTNVVKDVVSDGSTNTTKSFTSFLLREKHYTVLYKKWRNLGKKIVVMKLLYYDKEMCGLRSSLFIIFLIL